MEIFFIKATQLFLSLSILIVLHELGHFIPAKLFGIKVEKFYMFFDWKFSLLKIKRGDTEYGIGWIPFGGYVKIAGMIDESMDKDQLKSEPQPWEFRSKPTWQRLIVMVGGVTVNVILAILIYSALLFSFGKIKTPMASLKYGVEVNENLKEIGMQNGDHLLKIGDEELEYFSDVNFELLVSDYKSITVKRESDVITLPVSEEFKGKLLGSGTKTLFIQPLIPFVVSGVKEGMPAQAAGIKVGDRLEGVNGIKMFSSNEVYEAMRDNAQDSLHLDVVRGTQNMLISILPNDSGYIGITRSAPSQLLQSEHIQYSFFEALPAGVIEGGDKISKYFRSLKLLGKKEGVKQVGGFGSFGSMFPSTWDWVAFWNLTAFISIILAVMNILPIPALDGGHVMFLLYEMITGRPPHQKVLEYAQMVGMVLLLLLLVLANANDVMKFLF